MGSESISSPFNMRFERLRLNLCILCFQSVKEYLKKKKKKKTIKNGKDMLHPQEDHWLNCHIYT